MAKNKKRDARYTKSRAVKNSAKKANQASVLKRQQLKEANEQEAGNKEPSIDTDTGHEAQNNVEESVASEEPVEEPGQELAPEREPVLDQGPADEEEPIAEKEKETANEQPPVKAKTAVNLRKVTVRMERLAFNPDGSTKATKNKAKDADLEGGSSPPEKRRRMTRSTAKTMKNKKGKTFLKDKRYLSLLEFKRSVTTSLLLYGLNDEIGRKGDAPEARLMKEIPLSAEPSTKRRKDRLSVPDEIRFSQKRNCFLEFHDDRILDPTKAVAETVLAVDPEEENAVQTVKTDPLGIYPSSYSSDDSDFDVLNNDVNDGVLLDEDEWLK
ncbi:hypothetical protein DAPPUDRAFT_322930 [Daphnia pulex]|uniref:Uncharacterized protein n=1 Tax=Daphnia pulex TaxID=6669 RepID=E9GXC0_DAPPU|nr:hypothetical protein DAPPUDRAFT_322930 [Daphnia pulex]|eukprot:EFX75845.1 hypothetical protein DAPPUDRAFT_322930 [Daphnia pulex]